LQLMTIHKAKGLEFDTVIVPGLGRSVRTSERSLLLWQEQIDPRRVREGLLLAPIPASIADDQDPTYRAIASIHAEKDRQETLRLFYVAATRARQRLHLLGHAARNANGTLSPATGSLLKAAWSALGPLAETCTIETLPVNPSPKAPDRMLRRLPLGWSAPQLASAVAIALPARRRASDIGHQEGLSRSFSLRTDEGRIIGTVVHAWLEVIASEGVENWSPARLQTGRAGLCTTLMSSGVPRMRAGTCADRALKALGNTLLSPRGRWILARHRDAACEVALSGVVDGVAVHAVIDRTFVDEDGVLWIVDYKTSAPDEGVNLETFLVKESERYRGQLDDYRRLMSMRTPACDVRTALYFPLIDAWREVT
jgi:ATP-dependent exoDNAse (exonuclease V) beta subunit